MNEKDYKAEGQLALLNREYEKSFELFKKAIREDGKDPAGHKGAGCACVSMGLFDQGIDYFKQAIKLDPNNGNRYFDLGYAYAMSQQSGEAIKTFVKAAEIGCSKEVYADLYNLLGIICFEMRKYDDALVNFQKSEEYSGVNVELIQRKAVIYGMKGDLKNGILTANQLKMVTPSDYKGYQMAFRLLLQAKLFDQAEKELAKANKYCNLTSEYFFDKMTLELERYKADKNSERLTEALNVLAKALEEKNLTVQEVVDCYINAAEIYFYREKADETISCLNAALTPADSFNNDFKIIAPEFVEKEELTQEALDEMAEKSCEKAREKRALEGTDFMADENAMYSEFDEYSSGDDYASGDGYTSGDGYSGYSSAEGETLVPDDDFLTEIPDEFNTDAKKNAKPKLSNEGYELKSNDKDQINRLYIGAYTIKEDYEKVITYSKKLQQSENKHYIYMGKYSEAKAMLSMQSPEAEEKYRELNKFLRNAMIKEPTDLDAVSYRIQAYIDVKNYDEAESLCSLLSKEAREPLMEKINQEKEGR